MLEKVQTEISERIESVGKISFSVVAVNYSVIGVIGVLQSRSIRSTPKLE